MNATGAVDYRRTFLRRHVERELERIDDVMALVELRDSARQALRKRMRADPSFGVLADLDDVVAKRLTLEQYFGVDGLYIPLRVQPRAEDLRGHPGLVDLRDLTDLIGRLAPGSSSAPAGLPPGIVLTTRSGGGKTVAAIKAFRDCVLGPTLDDSPRLSGLLPCRLPVRPDLVDFEDARRSVPQEVLPRIDARVVETLILQAAHPIKASRGRWNHPAWQLLPSWLQYGPPLLLFVDLNAYGRIERRILARSLMEYQKKYPAHRCVVAYRFVSEADETLGELSHATAGGLPIFGHYDIESVDPDQAAQYLLNFQRVERELLDAVGLLKAGGDPLESSCATLRELICRQVTDQGDRSESLISTPLLMHFVAGLDDESLRGIETLSDLYENVIKKHLDRERKSVGFGPIFPDSDTILVALTRIALVMLSREDTRLDFDDYESVLNQPKADTTWWPDKPFWLDGSPPYYGLEFDLHVVHALLEFALLRREGDQVRFLHDSFIHAFAGIHALRFYRKPRQPPRRVTPHKAGSIKLYAKTGTPPRAALPEAWYPALIARFRGRPDDWLLPAEFLGGVLTAEEYAILLQHALSEKPRSGWPGVVLNLVRGGRRLSGQDIPLRAAVERALTHKRPGLFGTDGEHVALVGEVYHYLRDATSSPEIEGWPARLMGAVTARWLYSREPTNWPPPVLRANRKAVTRVAVAGASRIVTGDEDGRVIEWNSGAGTWRELYTHRKAVTSLAVSGDGTIVVSGDIDGAVLRAVDGILEPEPLMRHAGAVLAVAVGSDGKVVIVSGGDDGAVVRAVDGILEPEPLMRHAGAVLAVAVGSDGKVVASGGADGFVQCASGGRSIPLHCHRGRVLAVAVSSDGKVVASGGADGFVQCASGGRSIPLHRHGGRVFAVAVSGAKVVVSGGDDGAVLRAVDGIPEPEPLMRHEGWVAAVAVSDDGEIVVSGGEDGAVRLARSGVSLPPSGPVRKVALSSDGNVVVTGGTDGEVRRITTLRVGPTGGMQEDAAVAHHKGEVAAVAVDKTGQVIVSGGEDGTVQLVDGLVPARVLRRQPRSIHAVAASDDGKVVVSGGEERVVWLHRKADGSNPEQIQHHAGSVRAVAVSGDGRVVVSGGDDGAVLRAEEGAPPDPKPLTLHSGGVLAVAVSRDGTVVASGGVDGVVRRAAGPFGIAEVLRHAGSVRAVAVNGDGRVVVSGGDDATLRLWSLGEDPPLVYLCNAVVRGVALTSDGRTIKATLGNGELLSLEVMTGPP